MGGVLNDPICVHCGIDLHGYDEWPGFVVLHCQWCADLESGTDIGLINVNRHAEGLPMIDRPWPNKKV